MGQPQFVHLHVHTDYSLLDGACETSELLDEASRQKMPAVAITDHGNLFAAGDGYRRHLLTGCFIEQFGSLASPVEQAVIRVYVQMYELRLAHGTILKLPSKICITQCDFCTGSDSASGAS